MRPQPEKTQRYIFAMCTIFPAVLSILTILPMFAYKIDKATRDKMYVELNERRSAIAEKITEEDNADSADPDYGN